VSIRVDRYVAGEREDWNRFVAGSRNGTFLLDRGFMDYHADRFEDYSLVLRDESGDVVALLPANRAGDTLHSHQGLTYGGLVISQRSGSAAMLAMFDALVGYLREAGLAKLVYKTIPSIYHRQPAEEDRYALFRHDALLVRRDVLSVIPVGARLKPQERRLRGAKSARKAGVAVVESTDFAAFWNVLDENLRQRYGVAPVHSLDDIRLLHSRFPDAIRLFEARQGADVVAGVVMFETSAVAHVQYISASESGKQLHALDLLFSTLIEETFADKPFFDFGISNEEGGRVLNEGLVAQKEGFGARSVVHDYYELRID
jgi:hypothetical protein